MATPLPIVGKPVPVAMVQLVCPLADQHMVLPVPTATHWELSVATPLPIVGKPVPVAMVHPVCPLTDQHIGLPVPTATHFVPPVFVVTPLPIVGKAVPVAAAQVCPLSDE